MKGPGVRRGGAMTTLLVDLDDTLLDYTGGVDESWLDACRAMAATSGATSTPEGSATTLHASCHESSIPPE